MAAKQMSMNPFSHSREPKKDPKVLAEITVGRAADGGFAMKHHFAGYQHEPEHHPAEDGHSMLKHMAKHMGIEDVEIKKKGEMKAEPKMSGKKEEPKKAGKKVTPKKEAEPDTDDEEEY